METISAAKLIYITYMLKNDDQSYLSRLSTQDRYGYFLSQDINFQRFFYVEVFKLITDDFGSVGTRRKNNP